MKMPKNNCLLFVVVFAFLYFDSFSQSRSSLKLSYDTALIAQIMEQMNTPAFMPPFNNSNRNVHTLPTERNIPILSRNLLAGLPGALSCVDTSTKISYFSGIDSVTLAASEMISTVNGDYLIVGSYTDSRNNQLEFGCFVLRLDPSFQTVWIKKYRSAAQVTAYWYKLKELNDNTIMLAGNFYTDFSSMYGLFVSRISATGDLIWEKKFYPSTWLSSPGYAFIDVNHILQDQDDNIYISCREKPPSFALNNGILVKFDINGNKLWDRNPIEGYQSTGYGGSVIRNDKVITFGRTEAWSPSSGWIFGSTGIYEFDKSTGNLLRQKSYNPNDAPTYSQHWGQVVDLTEMNNGDVTISGTLIGEIANSTKVAASLQFKTADLSFVKGSVYNAIYPPANYRTKLKVFADGNSFFSYSDFPNPYTHSDFFIQAFNDVIVRQRSILSISTGTDYKPTPIQKSSDSYVFMLHKYDSANNFLRTNELFKVNISDSNSSCTGIDVNACTIDPITMLDAEVYFLDSGRNILSDTVLGALTVSNISIQSQQNCQQVIRCDSLKIIASKDTLCNNTNPILVKASRNINCRSIVSWSSNSPLIQSIQPLNDSSAFIWLTGLPGQCYISGSFNTTCGILSDSVKVIVAKQVSDLDLGPDIKICGNNPILLNARQGFKSYIWQDNSTDSTFSVSLPGIYFVSVTDHCNAVSSDTIIATSGLPDPIDIGNDRYICERDTTSLSGPAGFTSYTWSPNYNISNTSAQTVKVYPGIHTKYYLAAEKTPGCISTDSIEVAVYAPPSDFIFHDTIICLREKITLLANTTFAEYLWSTGSTAPTIEINTKGYYWLQVKNNYGCAAKEFINVDTKPCVTIVYLPNSFTPNNDSRNDVFKAGVYGTLKQYRLTVYNRYGQKLFETNDPAAGWDGTFLGKPQNQDTYTWVADYHQEGKPAEQQTGTVLLIR